MAQLVLLVVAAAWAAVLIPPMLRSRVENHPNSSVTDFRRQLNTLQSTSTPARGSLRAMGRPLTQSPLQRPAAAGRPGQHLHRQAPCTPAPHRRRPPRRRRRRRAARRPVGSTGDPPAPPGPPAPPDPHGPPARSAREIKRRRSNVLFVLVIAAACSMFLAATTGSAALLYVFALAFLALCGYVYLLAQLRQRDRRRRRSVAPVPAAVREPAGRPAIPVVRALLSAARLSSSHWGYSSVGRARQSHCRGQGFDSL